MRYLQGLYRLLAELEGTATSQLEAFDVQEPGGGRVIGEVVVYAGRVCWARAEHRDANLSDRLRDAAGASPGPLVELAGGGAAARAGLPAALASARSGDNPLRQALAAHVAAALATLTRRLEDGEAELGPHRPTTAATPACQGFTAAELLERAFEVAPEISLGFPPLPRPFTVTPLPCEAAFCFAEVSGDGPPLLVAARGAETELAAAEQLARSIRGAVLNPLFAVNRLQPFAVAIKHLDRGWLVSRIAPFLCLFRVSASGDHGMLLSLLANPSLASPTAPRGASRPSLQSLPGASAALSP